MAIETAASGALGPVVIAYPPGHEFEQASMVASQADSLRRASEGFEAEPRGARQTTNPDQAGK